MNSLETLLDLAIERYGQRTTLEAAKGWRAGGMTHARYLVIRHRGIEKDFASAHSLEAAAQSLINRLTNTVPPVNPVQQS